MIIMTKEQVREQLINLTREYLEEATVSTMVRTLIPESSMIPNEKLERIKSDMISLTEAYYPLLDSSDWLRIRQTGALLN